MGVSAQFRRSQVINIDHDTTFSSISQREPEASETWRALDEQKQDEVRNGPFSHWDFGAGELVKTAEKIIKVSVGRVYPSCRKLSYLPATPVWIV